MIKFCIATLAQKILTAPIMRGPSSEREGRRGSPHSRISLAMSNHAVGVSPDVYLSSNGDTPHPNAYFVKRGASRAGG